eukprot:augustus_masked-scaffold_83-processed-gene-0.1-mRNA-1 protein AED:0.95 eAED:1.00 QI:0/-1/0/1/-1/1/1/0/140
MFVALDHLAEKIQKSRKENIDVAEFLSLLTGFGFDLSLFDLQHLKKSNKPIDVKLTKEEAIEILDEIYAGIVPEIPYDSMRAVNVQKHEKKCPEEKQIVLDVSSQEPVVTKNIMFNPAKLYFRDEKQLEKDRNLALKRTQ